MNNGPIAVSTPMAMIATPISPAAGRMKQRHWPPSAQRLRTRVGVSAWA